MTQCGWPMKVRTMMTDYDYDNSTYSTVIKELVETLHTLANDFEPSEYIAETKHNISKLLSNEIDISLKQQQDYIDEYEKAKAKPELTGNVTELKPKGK